MDATNSDVVSQINTLLNELKFSDEEKSHISAKLPNLSETEQESLLAKLQNVKAWKVQVEIDEKLLELEEKYPQLIEKAKNEIMQILTEERKEADENKAQELLKKIEAMAQESDTNSNT